MKLLSKKLVLFILVLSFAVAIWFARGRNSEVSNIDDDESPVPVSQKVLPQDLVNTASDTSALGGYNVLIADRGNNRIIEVTPEKKIVWEYKFDLPRPGLGADDAFFADGGKTVIVNLEEYHLIEMIDYATKQVIWSYGIAGQPGSGAGMLHTPDDAYKLPNGDLIVADIKNCRVIEITPDKNITHQYGQSGQCGSAEGLLNKPNGDTPLANGHILISNIVGRNLVELDENWKPIFKMDLPVSYPSDPQLTKAGNILISDYTHPGKVVEVTKGGKIVWKFSGEEGDVKLNKPSLSIELPNGRIMLNDDLNHRVIVIDKGTNKIIWQYGVTQKPGSGEGQLNIPDGVDIIKRNAQPTSSASSSADPFASLPFLRIGKVSRHPNNYLNQNVKLSGYIISAQKGYTIFSDEASGQLGYFDLPVVGPGLDNLATGKRYVLEGNFVKSNQTFVNKNPYNLVLSTGPALDSKSH
ncbi:MAG: hypothetical protein NVSMB66_6640 [Candidatus Doudnabacteria bacterium]